DGMRHQEAPHVFADIESRDVYGLLACPGGLEDTGGFSQIGFREDLRGEFSGSLPSRDHQPQDLRFQPPTGIGAATLRATRTWLWPALALHRSVHVLEIDSHQLRNEPLVLPSDDRVADLG